MSKETRSDVLAQSVVIQEPRDRIESPLMQPGDVIRVAMTGAFLTGFAIDIEFLNDQDLRHVQQGTLQSLEQSSGVGWTAPGFTGATEGLRYSGAPYETVLPSSFLRSIGTGSQIRFEDLLATDSDRNGNLVRVYAGTEGTSWTPVFYQLDIYPFGVGTVAVTYDVRALEPLSTERLRVMVDNLAKTMVDPYNRAIERIVNEFKEGCRATGDFLVPAWIEASSSAGTSARRKRRPRWLFGEEVPQSVRIGLNEKRTFLLWLHRLYLLDPTSLSTSDTWSGLAPFFHRRHEYVGLTFIPGTETTVAMIRPDRLTTPFEADVIKVLCLSWAYFAAYAEIDRTLLARLNHLQLIPDDPKALERELRSTFDIYAQVRLFKARCNSQLADLGGAMIAHWEAVSEVQRMTQLMQSVEDKVDAIQEACRYRINRIMVARERRLGITVAVFTVFTVVSSVVQVAAYLFGQPTRYDGARALWISLLALATVLLAFTTTRNRGLSQG